MANCEQTETAYFGGGCFWCLEAVFERTTGVCSVTSGYAGGAPPHPTYEEVCSGTTGHAEMVKITFDPLKTDYQTLLELFFRAHDPTTLNRQGADVGSQYRSIVLFLDNGQEKAARAAADRAGRDYGKPVVTEIKTFKEFFQAEDYHQRYFQNNPDRAYCRMVIRPKLSKLGFR